MKEKYLRGSTMSKTRNIIWYHSSSPPQIIGNHSNGCYIGNYDGLHTCLINANKHKWKSVTVSQDIFGDYHLFQTEKHWFKYPSKKNFMANYETIKV